MTLYRINDAYLMIDDDRNTRAYLEDGRLELFIDDNYLIDDQLADSILDALSIHEVVFDSNLDEPVDDPEISRMINEKIDEVREKYSSNNYESILAGQT